MVGVSHDRYSKPSVEGAGLPSVHERYVGDMYVDGDVLFHVFPRNAAGAEWLILPVPYHAAEPAGGAKPFVVGVALKAKTASYAFRPSSIAYWLDPAQPMAPSGIQGPFDCGSQKALPSIVPVTTTVIPLAPGSCVYMWYSFDTVTPDPAQTFYVRMQLLVHDQDVDLPVIKFQQAKATHSIAVP